MYLFSLIVFLFSPCLYNPIRIQKRKQNRPMIRRHLPFAVKSFCEGAFPVRDPPYSAASCHIALALHQCVAFDPSSTRSTAMAHFCSNSSPASSFSPFSVCSPTPTTTVTTASAQSVGTITQYQRQMCQTQQRGQSSSSLFLTASVAPSLTQMRYAGSSCFGRTPIRLQ